MTVDRCEACGAQFEELEVFKRAYAALAGDPSRRVLRLPEIEQYGLADQIRRASKSICANIAEGFAKSKLLESRSSSAILQMAIGIGR